MNEPTVFDLYKLCVEMADRVSARRTSANTFFLSMHAGLLAAIGLFGSATPVDLTRRQFFLFLGGAAGLVLSAAWWLLLKSYRDLNGAKFKVINAMEETFPVKPFTDEWRILKRDKVASWRHRYAEQGWVERIVPLVVAGLYLLILGRLLFTL